MMHSELAGHQFATMLADPPWRFTNRTGKVAPEHRRLSRYETLAVDEIAAMPVAEHTTDTAHCYLWVPNALLPWGLLVQDAWGFDYKTNIVWHKVRKDGGSDGRGVGFYFRNVTEMVLFGVRGKQARTLAPGRSQVNLIASRKWEHSRKPDELYGRVGGTLYLCFVDESGTHGASPVLVVGGIVIHEEDAWHLQQVGAGGGEVEGDVFGAGVGGCGGDGDLVDGVGDGRGVVVDVRGERGRQGGTGEGEGVQRGVRVGGREHHRRGHRGGRGDGDLVDVGCHRRGVVHRCRRELRCELDSVEAQRRQRRRRAITRRGVVDEAAWQPRLVCWPRRVPRRDRPSQASSRCD